jgi:ammonium transporter, Amt family
MATGTRRGLVLAGARAGAVCSLLFLLVPPNARADEPASLLAQPAASVAPTSAISGADTGFILVSAALVMLMTPGLGLFYGGMVRRKNVLATFQQSFILLGVVSLQWVLFGYSLAFAPDALGGLIGGLDWVGLNGVGLAPNRYAPTIPAQLHMVYQLMFAVITPALISGAVAERMKFSAYLAFTLLWATFVYEPVAHWVWGHGWIQERLGAIDFAGGIVVHLISGIAALCCVLTMGHRKGLGEEEMHPHNLTMTALGTGLLWFGWFGFNAGSALAANASAVVAFVNTNTAGAAAAVAWSALEWLHKGKATVLGTCTGAVAGLACITPAAGYVSAMSALAIGILASLICYAAILLKSKLGYDDSLDVFGVHGVGGAFGTLAVGVLASAVVGGVDGLVHGNAYLLGAQAVAVLASAVYSFVVTFIVLKVVDKFIGLRVNADEEEAGLDLTQHGERGYIMGVGELMGGGRPSGLPSLADLARPAPEPASSERVGV